MMFWRAPEVPFGALRLPRIFLGDRGFLHRYGSKISLDEIERLMTAAAVGMGAGLAVSDEATAAAASKVRDVCGADIMLHTQNLLCVAERQDLLRCAATLRTHVVRRLPDMSLRDDDLVGGFLKVAGEASPYGIDELLTAAPDPAALAFAIRLIEQIRPSVITFGGDWLDLCLCTGRTEPVSTITRELRAAAGEHTQILALTYLGAVLCPDVIGPLGKVDGVAMPVNLLGEGMYPNRAGVVEWAGRAGGLALAVHALAMGRIPVAPALDFVWNHLGVPLAVVGASNDERIASLIAATKFVFSENAC